MSDVGWLIYVTLYGLYAVQLCVQFLAEERRIPKASRMVLVCSSKPFLRSRRFLWWWR